MGQILFYILLGIGCIKPAGDVDGRQIYDVDVCYQHITGAYQGEITRWLVTGDFQFDEDCRDKWIESK